MNLGDFNIYNKVKAGIVVYSQEDNVDISNQYVEIDDNFLYITQQLNMKGYITKFCCSGHYGYQNENNKFNDDVGGYIYFTYPHNFDCMPEGVYQENAHIIRFTFKSSPNTRERMDEINKYVTNIANWVDKLPNIN